MKAIIVDDEKDSIKILELMIAKFLPDVTIAGTFSDPADAPEKIKNLKPDIVFLDVQMPAITGFQLLRQIKFRGNIHHIFRTARSRSAESWRY